MAGETSERQSVGPNVDGNAVVSTILVGHCLSLLALKNVIYIHP